MSVGDGRGGLTVAVTGPTGSIGRAFIHALEHSGDVARIVGMARRPFDVGAEGWSKTEYRQGDILDPNAVDDLVHDADVVVHLAFLIMGSKDETATINLEGSSNVFRASLGNVDRLIYTSSVAAYGFHDENPDVLTEDIPARGTDSHYYSKQKAEVEGKLEELRKGSATDVYVFRPCIVAGPSALDLVTEIPYVQLGERMPTPLKKLIGTIPLLRPVVPDPGTPLQLVHEDDVASALVAAVLGKGTPGTYNLAGDGEIVLSDIAHALGWYAIPIPELAVDTASKIISRMPLLPATASWINAIRVPVLMDCAKARSELGWSSRYDTLETLSETVAAARDLGLLPWPGHPA